MASNNPVSKQPYRQHQWVKESAFGTWFLSTNTWVKYVLRLAIDDLYNLMPATNNHNSIIIDIGCGRGQSIQLLDEKFQPKKIIAVDIDPNAVRIATDAAKNCRCEVEFKTNNVADLDIPDESADLLLCHQTFHHLVEQEQALKEFYRVLKPGGQLLFAECCKRFIHSLSIRLLFRHPMHVQKSAQEYIDMIKDTGFTIETKSLSKPYLWWSRWDLGLLEKIGISPRKNRVETMINLVAQRPV